MQSVRHKWWLSRIYLQSCRDSRARYARFRIAIHFRRLPGTLILLVLVLFAARSSAEAQTKSLVLAVEDDASPWSRPDGSGYANDVVRAAFKAVGVAVELQVVPYARCKRMALRGEVAGCFNMSPSPEF